MNDFATLMDHDTLLAALGEQAPKSVPVQTYALRLLLEHANGVWFTDRDFVAKVVDDAVPGPEGRPVRVNFTKLAKLLDEVRQGPSWTYRHGRATSAVLWLACEMARRPVARTGLRSQCGDRAADRHRVHGTLPPRRSGTRQAVRTSASSRCAVSCPARAGSDHSRKPGRTLDHASRNAPTSARILDPHSLLHKEGRR